MLEVFAGGAVLTSVSKQLGLGGMAVDTVRKPNARCTIYQLDLLQASDTELLEEWLSSPLLLWVHFAPVCGTASRAIFVGYPFCAGTAADLPAVCNRLSGMHVWIFKRQADKDCGILSRNCSAGRDLRSQTQTPWMGIYYQCTRPKGLGHFRGVTVPTKALHSFGTSYFTGCLSTRCAVTTQLHS